LHFLHNIEDKEDLQDRIFSPSTANQKELNTPNILHDQQLDSPNHQSDSLPQQLHFHNLLLKGPPLYQPLQLLIGKLLFPMDPFSQLLGHPVKFVEKSAIKHLIAFIEWIMRIKGSIPLHNLLPWQLKPTLNWMINNGLLIVVPIPTSPINWRTYLSSNNHSKCLKQ